MAHKVRWSLEASKDLESIADYIARDSENYARLVVTKVLDSTRNFEMFPYAGRIVPEFSDPNIREVFIYNYRVIYEILDESVVILAIIHGSRILHINDRI